MLVAATCGRPAPSRPAPSRPAGGSSAPKGPARDSRGGPGGNGAPAPGRGAWSGGAAPSEFFGRPVAGPLGLAAGFDKDAHLAAGLDALGFAFIEVGTFTARAQPGNDRPRLKRVIERSALVNRMGFNNRGARAAARRLRRLRSEERRVGREGGARGAPRADTQRGAQKGATRPGTEEET